MHLHKTGFTSSLPFPQEGKLGHKVDPGLDTRALSVNAERRPIWGMPSCQTKDLPITNIVLDRKYFFDQELLHLHGGIHFQVAVNKMYFSLSLSWSSCDLWTCFVVYLLLQLKTDLKQFLLLWIICKYVFGSNKHICGNGTQYCAGACEWLEEGSNMGGKAKEGQQ